MHIELKEVKRRYYELVKLYHPDVCKGGEDVEERFRMITSAYAILSDSARKNAYDNFGAGWKGVPAFSETMRKRYSTASRCDFVDLHSGGTWEDYYSTENPAARTKSADRQSFTPFVVTIAIIGMAFQFVRFITIGDASGIEKRHYQSSRDLAAARRSSLLGRDQKLQQLRREHEVSRTYDEPLLPLDSERCNNNLTR